MPSISAQPPPLPSASTLLAEVRSSCSQCSTAIDDDALDALLREVAASSEPPSLRDYSLVMPLRWDSVGAEINFFSLVAVLSILSPLQCHINELPGGDNTPAMLVRQLLVGLYLSAPPSNHLSAPSPLSSAHLAALQENEVAEVLNLKIHVEKSVAHIPVATLAERGGPGSEIVARLTTPLNRVGQRLSDNRYVDLGAFVIETLAQCKGKANDEALGTFVHRLASFLPLDFGADSYTLSSPSGDKPLHVYKNAWYLLYALALRFDGHDQQSLPWVPPASSLATLPLLADGHIVSSLVSKGVVQVAGEESLAVTADEYNALRASVVAVGEKIRARGGDVTPAHLDAWLRRTKAPRSIVVEEAQVASAGMW